jgi:NitT/TauT family transport system substrate-binding protein
VPGSGIMAEREWLKSNRETAVKFVKAAFEAIALMKKDRAAFDAAVVKWMNITDKTAQDRMYDEIELPEKPYPSVEGIRHTFVLYDSPEMRKYRPEDFYDTSIMTELDRSGFIDRLYR